MSANPCVVLVTCPNQDEAVRLAQHLVQQRLAACVNVLGGTGGMQSFYWWEDAVQHEQEVLLIIKTTTERFDALSAQVHAHHSYTVPECIVLPILNGSSAYLDWIKKSVSPSCSCF